MKKEEDLTIKTMLAEIKNDIRDTRNRGQDQYESLVFNQNAQREVIKQLTTRVSDIQALLTKGQNGEKPLVTVVKDLREDSLKFKTTLEESEKTSKTTKKELDDLKSGSTITPPAVRVEQWKIVGSIATIVITAIISAITVYLRIN